MPDPNDLLRCLHSLNICCFPGEMCPCDDASLVAPRFPSCGNSSGGCQNVQMCFVLFPNLLNTPPSFRDVGPGEGGLFCLSLLKTLAIGDGLPECLLPCLLIGSVRAVDVLDSK
ncbi:hypothetical protein Tco_1538461 [Tanacetum coccineum]